MSSQQVLNRDEALLALHDHCGQEVEVNVDVAGHGDCAPSAVMIATGVLRHWRSEARAAKWRGIPRDDIEGLYGVGDASFDVTDLDAARALRDDDEPPYGLAFDLAPGVQMTVVWGAE